MNSLILARVVYIGLVFLAVLFVINRITTYFHACDVVILVYFASLGVAGNLHLRGYFSDLQRWLERR